MSKEEKGDNIENNPEEGKEAVTEPPKEEKLITMKKGDYNVHILIEEVKNGVSIGHTENFIKVEIPEKLEENKNYDVKVIKTYSDYVDGTLKK